MIKKPFCLPIEYLKATLASVFFELSRIEKDLSMSDTEINELESLLQHFDEKLTDMRIERER